MGHRHKLLCICSLLLSYAATVQCQTPAGPAPDVGALSIEAMAQAAMDAATADLTNSSSSSSSSNTSILEGPECAPPAEATSLPCANVVGEVTRRQLYARYIQPQLLCRQQQVAQEQCTLSSLAERCCRGVPTTRTICTAPACFFNGNAWVCNAGASIRRVISVWFHLVLDEGGGLYGWAESAPEPILRAQVAHLNTVFNGTGFQFELAGVSREIVGQQYYENTGGPTGSADPEVLRVRADVRKGGLTTLNVFVVGPENIDGAASWGATTWLYDIVSGAAPPCQDYVLLPLTTLPSAGNVTQGAPPAGDGGGEGGNGTVSDDAAATLPSLSIIDETPALGVFGIKGGALVHQVGHWLGLFHSFNDATLLSNWEVGNPPLATSTENLCAAQQQRPYLPVLPRTTTPGPLPPSAIAPTPPLQPLPHTPPYIFTLQGFEGLGGQVSPQVSLARVIGARMVNFDPQLAAALEPRYRAVGCGGSPATYAPSTCRDQLVPDDYTNPMDFLPDGCVTRFTPSQVAVMGASFNMRLRLTRQAARLKADGTYPDLLLDRCLAGSP